MNTQPGTTQYLRQYAVTAEVHARYIILRHSGHTVPTGLAKVVISLSLNGISSLFTLLANDPIKQNDCQLVHVTTVVTSVVTVSRGRFINSAYNFYATESTRDRCNSSQL